MPDGKMSAVANQQFSFWRGSRAGAGGGKLRERGEEASEGPESGLWRAEVLPSGGLAGGLGILLAAISCCGGLQRALCAYPCGHTSGVRCLLVKSAWHRDRFPGRTS